jgi:hypothetical protein
MKSGIEMIEEIVEKISLLDRRFTIIEQMMKELLNKANNSVQCKSEKPPSIGATSPLPELQIKPKTNVIPAAKIGEAPVGNVKTKTSRVMGKIKNSEGRVVSGVRVKVFDDNNNIVKETKTNKAGEWMCFLPPGKYGAEYFLKDMINANVNFNVTSDQKLIRVAQANI